MEGIILFGEVKVFSFSASDNKSVSNNEFSTYRRLMLTIKEHFDMSHRPYFPQMWPLWLYRLY